MSENNFDTTLQKLTSDNVLHEYVFKQYRTFFGLDENDASHDDEIVDWAMKQPCGECGAPYNWRELLEPRGESETTEP